MALVCRWRFEMYSWKAASRVVLHLLVAAACTSCVGAARPSLAEALLEDMLPASSTKCVGGGTTAFTFNHTSSQSTSKWDEVAVMFERSVFLAEMSHAESNANRSWTLRVGNAARLATCTASSGRLERACRPSTTQVRLRVYSPRHGNTNMHGIRTQYGQHVR